MKIAGLGVSFPEREVENQDILREIEIHSSHLPSHELQAIIDQTIFYLELSESRSRHWSQPNENVRNLMTQAVYQALDEAGLSPHDIELVVHASVVKHFGEPGDSYFAADACGMHRAKCFDVIDACSSWATAALLIDDLFVAKRYRNAIIVNSELANYPGMHVYPRVFKLNSIEEIDWKFPVQTMGDCVTATVLVDNGKPWQRQVYSAPELAGLCFIPNQGADSYLQKCLSFPQIDYEDGVCTSFGKHLFEKGRDLALQNFHQLNLEKSDIDLVIPHTSGKRMWQTVGEMADIVDKMHFIYPETGNVVSAAFPAGLASARKNKLIDRGSRVVGWLAAAGMSFTSFTFQF